LPRVVVKSMIRRGFPAQGSPRKIFSLSFPARQGMREAALPGPLASPWRPPRPPARQPSPDPAAPRRGTACAAPAARGCGLRHGLVRLRPADPSCGGWNKSFRDFGAGKSRANIGGACPMQTYGQGSAGGAVVRKGSRSGNPDGRWTAGGFNLKARFCCRFAADAATSDRRHNCLLWLAAARGRLLGVYRPDGLAGISISGSRVPLV